MNWLYRVLKFIKIDSINSKISTSAPVSSLIDVAESLISEGKTELFTFTPMPITT